MNILTVPVDLNGIWSWGWAFGLIALLLIGYARTLPRFIAVAAVYFAIRSVWILEAPLLPFGDYTRAFQATAGRSALEMVVIIGAAIHLRSSKLNWISFLVVAEIIGIWYQRAGLMGWESFDLALIALALPFVPSFPLKCATVLTIMFHHGVTAMAIILAELLAVEPVVALMALPIVAILLYVHHLPGLDRFDEWSRLMRLWWSCGWSTRVFGTGGGSFMWISVLSSKSTEVFLHMHNDWLQILFEQGFIGLALVVGVFVRCARAAWHDKELLAGVFGAGVFAMGYHPLRFFPSALLIAVIFSLAIKRDGERIQL